LHFLTTGMRKAAAAAGDPERVHLWAGTGFRHATEEPADSPARPTPGGTVDHETTKRRLGWRRRGWHNRWREWMS
jgi:hypothetical protein